MNIATKVFLSDENNGKYLVSFFMLIIWKSAVAKIPIVYANMKGSETKGLGEVQYKVQVRHRSFKDPCTDNNIYQKVKVPQFNWQ